MKTIIQTPGFTAKEALTSFVEEKVGKLSSLSPSIHEARVTLRLDKSDSNKNKACEIKLVVPGNDIFASRQCESFEEAVTATIEALKHQLARFKSDREK